MGALALRVLLCSATVLAAGTQQVGMQVVDMLL